MMKYLQKLGKALMLPVAALPVCGILMGIGYAFAPAVMGAEGATSGFAYTLGFLLIKAGGALIDNMAWLFAIGAAVGLSDDHDGTAGLAGLVSFLMMQQLLSPGVVGAVRTLEEGSVDYIAFSKIAGNSFIGILAAIIGAACYNKFKNTQLPDWLAFFSGKRFVAIATGLISIVVSVVLLFVWPVIFGVLVALEVSDNLKDNETVKELGKDIGMQAAAMNPSFLDKSDVDEATLAKEKEILLIQALEENKTAAKPKPEQIIHKMVDGRIGKYYEENCLLQQAFVKENKVSVEAHIKAVAKELGGEIKLVKCVRFEKGEGIEKKVDDFAAEVASMAK